MELCAPNKLEYCLRHGVQLTIKKHSDSVVSSWGERTEFMIEELERMPQGDWLWFMGADTLITNMTTRLDSILTDDAPDFIIAKDMHAINNDVFFLRRSDASLAFLQEVHSLKREFGDDQQAMINLLQRDKIGVRYETQVPFNSYLFDQYRYYKNMHLSTDSPGHWVPGRFVLHLPGLPVEKRIELMTAKLKEVVR